MTHLTIKQHFHKAGLAHLFQRATLLLFLTGAARLSLEEDLRTLILQMGAPPTDVDRYAAWTIHMATLHLVGYRLDCGR